MRAATGYPFAGVENMGGPQGKEPCFLQPYVPDDDGVGRARPVHGIVNHRPRARLILRFAVSVRP